MRVIRKKMLTFAGFFTHKRNNLSYINMAKFKGAITVNTEQCKGCGVCVGACPDEVIALSHEVNSKGYTFAYMRQPAACTGCVSCAQVCPDSVITVYKVKVE
jgi:2-oxoglutarate ferredoxin oxidoreductase subunit delta